MISVKKDEVRISGNRAEIMTEVGMLLNSVVNDLEIVPVDFLCEYIKSCCEIGKMNSERK